MFGQIDASVKGGNEIQEETPQNDTGALGSRGEGLFQKKRVRGHTGERKMGEYENIAA